MSEQKQHKERVTAIILAAGLGKRMKSSLPKVLHKLCGRPQVEWVVEAALQAGADDAVVVVGHAREKVEAHLRERYGERVRFALQEEQNGTGHAALCALPAVPEDAEVALLLYGDTPLVRGEDLAAMLQVRRDRQTPLSMLTCRVPDPTGYGRILRDGEGHITSVREHRDCTPEQRAIGEVNPGMYAAKLGMLREALAGLTDDNDQGELYLTDVVEAAAKQGGVADVDADADTLVGINDRAQLAAAEQQMYERIANRWRKEGATIRAGVRIDAEVTVGRDATLEHGVVLRGKTAIGEQAIVDVGSVLTDVTVGASAYLQPYSVAAQSSIGDSAKIGPFSHLRPASDIGPEAKVGNFVETKKVRLARGAKANHLSYLGDGEVGEKANIGAGTIFCNYDGFQKHKTVIEEGAFIGSDSQLVAPVRIGKGSYVATGTTITMDVPDDSLAIGRTRQVNKEGYASRLRGRLKASADAAKAKKAAEKSS